VPLRSSRATRDYVAQATSGEVLKSVQAQLRGLGFGDDVNLSKHILCVQHHTTRQQALPGICQRDDEFASSSRAGLSGCPQFTWYCVAAAVRSCMPDSRGNV